MKIKKDLVLAHNSQTKIIQNVATGKEYGQSSLFTHGHDTLMTVASE